MAASMGEFDRECDVTATCMVLVCIRGTSGFIRVSISPDRPIAALTTRAVASVRRFRRPTPRKPICIVRGRKPTRRSISITASRRSRLSTSRCSASASPIWLPMVCSGESAVIAHVLEANQIRLMPVTIGESVTLGRGSVVFPGASIGDRAIIGAMSLVPKGKALAGNAVYAGTPVEKLRDRQAKDEPVKDPLTMSAKELLLSSGHTPAAVPKSVQREDEPVG